MALFSKPINSKTQLRVPVLILVSLLLLARSRVASLVPISRVNPLSSEKPTEQQLKDARQQLYFEEGNRKTLLLPFRGNIIKVGIPPLPLP